MWLFNPEPTKKILSWRKPKVHQDYWPIFGFLINWFEVVGVALFGLWSLNSKIGFQSLNLKFESKQSNNLKGKSFQTALLAQFSLHWKQMETFHLKFLKKLKSFPNLFLCFKIWPFNVMIFF